MACWQEEDPEHEESLGPSGSTHQKEDHTQGPLHGTSGEGRVQGACLDLGLYL